MKIDLTKPKDLTSADAVFGNVDGLMPEYSEIPDKYKNGHTKGNELFSDWFFLGCKKTDLKPRDGIDKDKALAYIVTIMRSYRPKHEHKEATCAYLFELWFEKLEWEANKPEDTK